MTVVYIQERWLRTAAVLCCIIFAGMACAQPVVPVFMKDTRAENREKLYRNLIQNTISKNLSLPLADSTEENWMDAFYAMELVRFTSPFTEGRIREALGSIEKRSIDFQYSLMEMLFDSYPSVFEKDVQRLMMNTADAKLLAMCGEYLIRAGYACREPVRLRTWQQLQADSTNAILLQLKASIDGIDKKINHPPLKDLLYHPFFSNAKVLFSFQRRNRNYPGIVIIRDSAGNFSKDVNGNIFYVQQLARSISNLPGYISNGNTPQGIFRMHGFGVSKSNFIGPTPNIQLTMPVETSIQHFMNDSSITDTAWTEGWYNKLLPESWKNYLPVYQAYYAGSAGRTEIIAHGSTVDPSYYKRMPCWPLTPTLGCLCTTELWSGADGRRMLSDQQQLVDALKKAGGADGYCVVIELDDEQRPVSPDDIKPFLK